MTKLCFKCNEHKTTDHFYKHKAMKDGLLGKCKACTKKDVLEHRASKLDAIREYDRQRGKLPHRIANAVRVTREWRRKHKERASAQSKAHRAGIESPGSCERCGNDKVRLEKHHPDYSQPLMVVWLCKPCHAIADKARRQEERQNG